MNAVVIERSGPIAAIASGFGRVFTRREFWRALLFCARNLRRPQRRIDRHRGARLGGGAAARYRGGGDRRIAAARRVCSVFDRADCRVLFRRADSSRGLRSRSRTRTVSACRTFRSVIRWDCRPLARASAVASLAFFATAGNAPAAATRDALLARWNHANPHAGRLVEHDVRTLATPPANLRALAARELATGYRLTLPKSAALPAADKPWWMRLWTWLSDRLTQLWRAAFGNARLGRRGAIAIGDVLIAAAIALIVLVAWRLLRGFAFERSRGESLELLAPPPNARALYDAACDRARQKDYAAASRLLFAAMVASPRVAWRRHRGSQRNRRRVAAPAAPTRPHLAPAVRCGLRRVRHQRLRRTAGQRAALGGGARRIRRLVRTGIAVKHAEPNSPCSSAASSYLPRWRTDGKRRSRAGRLPRCIRPTTPVPTGIARSTRRCAVRACRCASSRGPSPCSIPTSERS